MSINKVHRNRFARELLNGDLLYAQQGMVEGALHYKSELARAALLESEGKPASVTDQIRLEALANLRANIHWPKRVLFEITEKIETLTVRFGSKAAALNFIDTAFLEYQEGLITRQEMQTYLNGLIAVVDVCIDGIKNQDWAPEQAADYVIANVEGTNEIFAKTKKKYIQEWE